MMYYKRIYNTCQWLINNEKRTVFHKQLSSKVGSNYTLLALYKMDIIFCCCLSLNVGLTGLLAFGIKNCSTCILLSNYILFSSTNQNKKCILQTKILFSSGAVNVWNEIRNQRIFAIGTQIQIDYPNNNPSCVCVWIINFGMEC